MGVRHSALLTGKNDTSESSISRFFGFFFMVFSLSSIVGNLIGSFGIFQTLFSIKLQITDCCRPIVLSAGASTHNVTTKASNPGQCGANFCYDHLKQTAVNLTDDDAAEIPANRNVPMLMGILLGFALLATLILIFLVDPPPPSGEKSSESSTGKKYVWKMLMATFRQMKDPNQLLVIPLTLWSGLDMAFWGTDFTLVRCAQ